MKIVAGVIYRNIFKDSEIRITGVFRGIVEYERKDPIKIYLSTMKGDFLQCTIKEFAMPIYVFEKVYRKV